MKWECCGKDSDGSVVREDDDEGTEEGTGDQKRIRISDSPKVVSPEVVSLRWSPEVVS